MSPDGPDKPNEQPDLPARRPSPVAERNRRRKQLLAAQDFCQSIAFDNPKVRYRYREGMKLGTLPPPIEKALLDIGYGRPASIDKRLSDVLNAGRGLTLLLRKALTVDPLAEAKPVEGRVVIDLPRQEETPTPQALPPRASIVPPSRPSKRAQAQGKATLKPGEEELR